ncbi:MAG: hypothetical protein LM590_11365 [Thermofilum sp.]|nr:hypothetical protein [Thermofilum sp.]
MHLSGAITDSSNSKGLVSVIEITLVRAGPRRRRRRSGGVNHVKFKVITDGRSRALLRGK